MDIAISSRSPPLVLRSLSLFYIDFPYRKCNLHPLFECFACCKCNDIRSALTPTMMAHYASNSYQLIFGIYVVLYARNSTRCTKIVARDSLIRDDLPNSPQLSLVAFSPDLHSFISPFHCRSPSCWTRVHPQSPAHDFGATFYNTQFYDGRSPGYYTSSRGSYSTRNH